MSQYTRAREQWIYAIASYVVLAVLITWPLAARLVSHLPLGVLGEPTVPFFNLWTLAWNAERLAAGLRDYWDAPIFFPAHDTFALSEPQGLTGLWFAPFAALFGPVAAYNLVLLGTLVLNACAARRLLRVLGALPLAASLGGALMLGLQFVRHELGVLQLCAAWPVIFGLAELAILARAPSPAALLRLGLWLVATGWTCLYYALFFGVFVVLAALVFVRRAFLRPRMLIAGALALGLVAGGLLPLMAAERRAVSGYTRSARSIHSGSASGTAYLQFPVDTVLARAFPRWARPPHRRSLYPGALVCVLAAVGVARARRMSRPRFWWFAGLCFGLALWISFGTRLHFGDVQPYELTAQRYLPGFGQLRSPYRAALFVHVLVIMWAALGLDRVEHWAVAKRWRAARALPVLCAALALAEVLPLRMALERFPYEVLAEPWVSWLAAQPAGAVAMVPPNAGGQAVDYVDTTLAMLQGLQHRHPIVNGYSGFFPAGSDHMTAQLRVFPNPQTLKLLRQTGVRYVVVDQRWPKAQALEQRAHAGLEKVFADDRRSVFLLRP